MSKEMLENAAIKDILAMTTFTAAIAAMNAQMICGQQPELRDQYGMLIDLIEKQLLDKANQELVELTRLREEAMKNPMMKMFETAMDTDGLEDGHKQFIAKVQDIANNFKKGLNNAQNLPRRNSSYS